jgi:hypothetical protein
MAVTRLKCATQPYDHWGSTADKSYNEIRKFVNPVQRPREMSETIGAREKTAKKRLKFLPIVLFRRLRKMFLHNSFSHKRLERNEVDLSRPNSGFWVKGSILGVGFRRYPAAFRPKNHTRPAS